MNKSSGFTSEHNAPFGRTQTSSSLPSLRTPASPLRGRPLGPSEPVSPSDISHAWRALRGMWDVRKDDSSPGSMSPRSAPRPTSALRPKSVFENAKHFVEQESSRPRQRASASRYVPDPGGASRSYCEESPPSSPLTHPHKLSPEDLLQRSVLFSSLSQSSASAGLTKSMSSPSMADRTGKSRSRVPMSSSYLVSDLHEAEYSVQFNGGGGGKGGGRRRSSAGRRHSGLMGGGARRISSTGTNS